MSRGAQAICPVPKETARIARAAYPKGNVYMQMRDVLGSIYTDEDFVELFPKEGQPKDGSVAISPGHRAAICGEPRLLSKQQMRCVQGSIGSTFSAWN